MEDPNALDPNGLDPNNQVVPTTSTPTATSYPSDQSNNFQKPECETLLVTPKPGVYDKEITLFILHVEKDKKR